MLEVFFSESAKYSRQMSENIKDTEAIVSLDAHLDIGDISNEIDSFKRHELLNNLFDGTDSATQRKEIEKIIAVAKAGGPIRIWKSETPSSTCGFAFLCDELTAIDCEVYIINLPTYVFGADETIVTYNHWGEVSPEEFDLFIAFEKKLTQVEKERCAKKWQELRVENSPLRAIVNGEILSVPENFYDFLILSNLPNEEFVIEDLIALLMGKYSIGVSDGWYRHRIMYLMNEKNRFSS